MFKIRNIFSYTKWWNPLDLGGKRYSIAFRYGFWNGVWKTILWMLIIKTILTII